MVQRTVVSPDRFAPRRSARPGVVGTALLAACSLPASVSAADTLTASVDRSEWKPSQTLTLNLDAGTYTIVPPASGWPAIPPKPAPRTGRLSEEPLRKVRSLARAALTAGFAIPACERAGGAGWPLYVSNAAPPTVSIATAVGTTTAKLRNCWSSELVELQQHVEQLFDGRSP